ncbi:MAG: TetR/AcrR family transcriptional regulator [Gammaproteobacteria bacterium]
MRYGPDHKQRTRERVLRAAASAIRSAGPHRVSVAAVMTGAGLTHGGFYAHFASKDELVTEAISQMFADARARFERETAGLGPDEALGNYIEFYLSRWHRDARERGCPVPFLAADLPRLTGAARARFAAGIAWMTGSVTRLLEELGRPDPEALAASAVAELVGALTVARAIGNDRQSDLILAHSAFALRNRLGLANGRCAAGQSPTKPSGSGAMPSAADGRQREDHESTHH